MELISIHTEGRAKWTEAPYDQAFFGNNAFCGANVHKAVQVRAPHRPALLRSMAHRLDAGEQGWLHPRLPL